ncbi:hypothetical protein V1279_003125 [Bradyrhizobium sp. AZCC 1610]|uniref:DUF3168 domain-containing protein n=1 Tax=Bradyrhizobium sp. AZCC 1610 TaxID=3117020 RepID=UPI002FF3E9ED
MRHDPSLALQKAIRNRLVASPDVLALVPAGSILDTNGRPEVVPVILLGEGQTVPRRFYSTSYATIHVWIDEPGLVQAKQVGSAIVGALTFDAEVERAVLRIDGFDCHDLAVTNLQYMRDPHANYSHAIVTVAGIMKERA